MDKSNLQCEGTSLVSDEAVPDGLDINRCDLQGNIAGDSQELVFLNKLALSNVESLRHGGYCYHRIFVPAIVY